MSQHPRLHDVVKAYDIRGVVPDQLDPVVARALGAAYAQEVVVPEGAAGLVVGHDMRPSSPALARAFSDGARSRGVDVIFIGLASTDGLYYASGSLDLAGAMFTASHNPAQYNGIKLCRPGARPVSLESGLAQVRDTAQAVLDGERSDTPAEVPGGFREQDVLTDYADFLLGLVDLSSVRPLTVVVDAGNGMAGLTVPAVLRDVPVRLVPLYFELDGTFPNHEPNPLEPENLRDLQAAVRAHGADLGLAFDGDADRCFVIDERGRPVTASAITALVAAREIARARAADPTAEVAVVHNLISSRVVPEVIEECGGRAVRSRVGHSYIKADMARAGAVFGGEHSAHYYFRDFWFADTGMLAALHVLAALGEHGGPLSELIAGYDRYVSSGELNSRVEDAAAAAERVRAWGQAQGEVGADDLDGLTLTHDAAPWWWLNLRGSNTEPLLRLNVESADPETLAAVRDAVLAIVRQTEVR